jgi:hypothetical protein
VMDEEEWSQALADIRTSVDAFDTESRFLR